MENLLLYILCLNRSSLRSDRKGYFTNTSKCRKSLRKISFWGSSDSYISFSSRRIGYPEVVCTELTRHSRSPWRLLLLWSLGSDPANEIRMFGTPKVSKLKEKIFYLYYSKQRVTTKLLVSITCVLGVVF